MLTRRLFGTLQLGALVAACSDGVLSLRSCEDASTDAMAVYILIDISGSYFKELPKVMTATKALLTTLHASDSIAVAEIGACSFSDDAILFKFSAPTRPSDRAKLVSAAAAKLDAYQSKVKQTQYTDIRGALTQAAQYLHSRPAGRKNIIIFSDMEEDLPANCKREVHLPADLKGVNVIASNVIRLREDNLEPARYMRRLEMWQRALTDAGASWRVLADASDLLPLLRNR